MPSDPIEAAEAAFDAECFPTGSGLKRNCMLAAIAAYLRARADEAADEGWMTATRPTPVSAIIADLAVEVEGATTPPASAR